MATIRGTDAGETLNGGSGRDKIYGNAGDDILYGEAGRDRLYGGEGNDTLQGGADNDRLDGGSGNDKYIFYRGDGRDTISDDDGLEGLYFKSAAGIEAFHISRLGGDVKIVVGSDTVIIDENSYADGRYSLFHRLGDDALGKLFLGTSSSDNIVASAENDLIKGGAGDDTLQGGDGDDTYIFNVGDGIDTISDTQGSNSIYFKSSDSGSYEGAIKKSNFVKEGDNLIITIEVDGSEQRVIVNDFFLEATRFTIYYNNGSSDKFFTVPQTTLTPTRELQGSADDDRLDGDDGSDTLYGLAGDDVLDGREGDDTLVGGDGWDLLYGGNGNDILNGGEGDDELYGGGNNDVYRFIIGDEFDLIDDSQGSNRVEFLSSSNGAYISLLSEHFTRDGNNLLIFIGDEESEQEVTIKDYYLDRVEFEIYYNQAIDGELIRVAEDVISDAIVAAIEDVSLTLIGSDGDDTLNGRSRNDVISGGDGNDILNGAEGADTINGGNGNDVINGGRGVDRLNGGDGDDTYIFERGHGADSITDASGQESLYFKDATVDSLVFINYHRRGSYNNYYPQYLEIVDRYAVNDVVTIAAYSNYASGRYSLFYGADDTPLGLLYIGRHDSHNTLTASEENDFITGGSGYDTLRGNGGDDTIYGYGGTDRLYGGDGNDIIYGGDGGDRLYGGAGRNQLYAGSGADTIHGGSGFDVIDGGAHTDTLTYSESIDDVTVNLATGRGFGGYAEGDTITNVENIIGSDYNDTLIGDAADNVITGGSGNDQLQGSAGDDTYKFTPGEGNDVISDAQGDNVVHFISLGSSYVANSLAFSKSEGGADLIIDAEAGVYRQQVIIEDYYLLPEDASFSIYYGSSYLPSATLITADLLPAV